MQSDLTRKLEIRFPIIQAPLGGGPGTPELTAAVSNAGAIGSLAGAYLSIEDLAKAIRKTKELTTKPFIVNLFAPSPIPCLRDENIKSAIAATKKYRDELALPEPGLKASPFADFDRQMEVVYRERPRAFSFTFGLIDKKHLDECRRLDILTIGTATTVAEASSLRESGVDAICVQGYEAGGHRGIFSTDDGDPQIATLDLVRMCAQEIPLPLIAAGGIMSGQKILQALQAGAQAAQLGTAFMLCPETATPTAYREALKNKNQTTRLTRVFSGRLARGIENKFLIEMENEPRLPWPAQNAFTRDMRVKSAQLGKPDFLSLWAGTEFARLREMPAAELVRTLVDEAGLG